MLACLLSTPTPLGITLDIMKGEIIFVLLFPSVFKTLMGMKGGEKNGQFATTA